MTSVRQLVVLPQVHASLTLDDALYTKVENVLLPGGRVKDAVKRKACRQHIGPDRVPLMGPFHAAWCCP